MEQLILYERPESLLRTLPVDDVSEETMARVMAAVEREGRARHAVFAQTRHPETLLRRPPGSVTSDEAVIARLMLRLKALVARSAGGVTFGPRASTRWLAAVAAACLVTSVGGASWLAVGERESRPDGASAGVGAASVRVVVSRVTGEVEVKRGTKSTTLRVGEELSIGDTVRTAGAAELTLTVGDGAVVVVDSGSEMRLDGVQHGAPEFDVIQGRVEGRVSGEPINGRMAFAHARRRLDLVDGRLGVLRAAGGELKVAAVASALVDLDGLRVGLPAGELLHLEHSEGERTPINEPLPAQLVLVLIQEKPVSAADRKATISGRVGPHVLLTINDTEVLVDDSGSFSAKVEVSRDQAGVHAVVRDPLGGTRRESLTLERASAPSKVPG